MTPLEINNKIAELDGRIQEPPSYISDLNAVHGAESRIIGNKDTPSTSYWVEYVDALKDEAGAAMFRATAIQRCRAILKARKVWKE